MKRQEFDKKKRALEEECDYFWRKYETKEREYRQAKTEYKEACDILWEFINKTTIEN